MYEVRSKLNLNTKLAPLSEGLRMSEGFHLKYLNLTNKLVPKNLRRYTSEGHTEDFKRCKLSLTHYHLL